LNARSETTIATLHCWIGIRNATWYENFAQFVVRTHLSAQIAIRPRDFQLQMQIKLLK
jgi:hypothetical protein